MVVLHPETGLPLICDLCDGDPACVKRCPTGAISYGDAAADPNQHPAAAFVIPGDQPRRDAD
jgi:ferredoxin